MPVQEIYGIPVLRCGYGDITVGRVIVNGKTVGIAATELDESLPIGAEVQYTEEAYQRGLLTYIFFDKIEALDVWLEVLNEVKAHMVAQVPVLN